MPIAPSIRLTVHDDVPPAEAAVIDAGLGAFNDEAMALRDVRGLAAFARDASNHVVGGAVGRTWGECCELQQLWVAPAHRRAGLGARLVREFEQRAVDRGCRRVSLETFSFQAQPFYEALGYSVALELRGYTQGVAKFTMTKPIAAE
jgi:GNAT superfamily N-acetyltransferase